MATTAQVLTAALQKILVQASEAPLEASEFQSAIFAMNNYMTSLDAQGVALGYTIVDSLDDEVTVPPGALQGLVANVAIVLAVEFDADVTPALVMEARDGLKAMRNLGVTIAPMIFPSTLPIGSGNEGHCRRTDRHFFPGPDENILTETGDNIGLESDT